MIKLFKTNRLVCTFAPDPKNIHSQYKEFIKKIYIQFFFAKFSKCPHRFQLRSVYIFYYCSFLNRVQRENIYLLETGEIQYFLKYFFPISIFLAKTINTPCSSIIRYCIPFRLAPFQICIIYIPFLAFDSCFK